MKISKGTIVRLIAVAFVVINLILKAFGKNPIDADEGTIGAWVEMILEVAIIIAAFWKNNSFSQAAIKADEFLNNLRNGMDEMGAGNFTFDDFVNAYLGKSTDYDGVSGVQCVDLIKIYLDKLFGIKPGAWGNAKEYWLSFSSRSPLVQNFTKIEHKSGLIPQKGDIVVWSGGISSGGYGHVAIATGEGNASEFYTYDQNWGGKAMKKVKHTYSCVYGFLRPKDQSNIVTASSESYPKAVTWKNGSTKEAVFKQSNLQDEVGTIYAKSSADCYGKQGSGYIVVYALDGTSKHKAGFVKYAGGVSKAPTGGKTYKNGSTTETVYADTAKKTKIGSLDKKEECICLGKIDGMYLVLYKINGTFNYKCGFVAYSGGVK